MQSGDDRGAGTGNGKRIGAGRRAVCLYGPGCTAWKGLLL